MKKRTGILEIMPEGNGFLRNPDRNFQSTDRDTYVSSKLIREFRLREGLLISGIAGDPPRAGQSAPLKKVESCNGRPVKAYAEVADIRSTVSIDPEDRLHMKMDEHDITGRIIDAVTPIGRGQRGLIVSPPKAGKTTILKHIAKAVKKNHPEIHVCALLIDERPEEVTDFQRDLNGTPVYHSSSDQSMESHIRVTQLTMSMVTRMVEFGDDVVVILDSLTRMGRAFNTDTPSGGKTMTGGLGANALELPRRFFGAARNIETGGSLTIMASILVDTGSRMDDIIFHEFKGTGNLDLILSRECADQRLYPAINIQESGTRKEHKLLEEDEMETSARLRRAVAGMKVTEGLQYVLDTFRN